MSDSTVYNLLRGTTGKAYSATLPENATYKGTAEFVLDAPHAKGDAFTLSFDVRLSAPGQLAAYLYNPDGNTNKSVYVDGTYVRDGVDGYVWYEAGPEWRHVAITWEYKEAPVKLVDRIIPARMFGANTAVGTTVEVRNLMLVEGTEPAAWAPADGESLAGGGALMSANLLDGLTPMLYHGTTEDGGVFHKGATTGHYDLVVWDLPDQAALETNQTYHVGLSVRGAARNVDSLWMAVGYKDASGARNWVKTYISIGTSWGRAEGTLVVPSGMTPFAAYITTFNTGPETWMTAPTLSLGSPVPLASSAHTPYATQDHVMATYATKASLKVTDDSIKAEVSARAQTDRNVADLSSRLTQTANSLTSEISDRRSAITTVTGLANAAQSTADAAKSSASSAVSTANSASTSAANAVKTANSASSTASAASTAAGKASTDAASAVKTANSASSTAGSAVTTANSAKSTADAASSTASAAKSTADSAAKQANLYTIGSGAAGAVPKWIHLGTLTSAGDASSATIAIVFGDGYNGGARQNSTMTITIKDGYQSTPSATKACGVTAMRENCDDALVDVLAQSATVYDVWVYAPWAYSNGRYSISGQYAAWQHSGATQKAEPATSATQVKQDVAYRLADATKAQTMATENQSSIKQLSTSITAEVTARTKTDRLVSEVSSRLTQTADGFSASIDRLSDTDKKVNSWFGFGSDSSGNPQLTMGSSTSPVVGVYTNAGLAYKARSGATLLELDGASRSSTMPHVHADDVSIGSWQWVPTQGGTHFTLQWIGG